MCNVSANQIVNRVRLFKSLGGRNVNLETPIIAASIFIAEVGAPRQVCGKGCADQARQQAENENVNLCAHLDENAAYISISMLTSR